MEQNEYSRVEMVWDHSDFHTSDNTSTERVIGENTWSLVYIALTARFCSYSDGETSSKLLVFINTVNIENLKKYGCEVD